MYRIADKPNHVFSVSLATSIHYYATDKLPRVVITRLLAFTSRLSGKSCKSASYGEDGVSKRAAHLSVRRSSAYRSQVA
jgi:hypothetical protein